MTGSRRYDDTKDAGHDSFNLKGEQINTSNDFHSIDQSSKTGVKPSRGSRGGAAARSQQRFGGGKTRTSAQNGLGEEFMHLTAE